MSASIVQHAFGRVSNGLAVTTDAIDTASSGRAFVVICNDTSNMADPEDNYGNTFTPLGAGNDNAGNRLRAWYCVNGNGGVGHQVTGTKPAAGYMVMMLLEISDALTVGAIDTGAYAEGADDFDPYEITTNGANLAQADNLIIAAITHSAATTDNMTVGSPFSIVGQEMDTGQYWPLGVAARNTSGDSPVTVSFSKPTSANQTGLLIITVKSAASGGGTTTLTADGASIAETVSDANLAVGRVLESSPVVVADSTSDANLVRSLNLTADTASYADTTSDASFRRALAVGGSSAAVNLAINDAGLSRASFFAADVAAASLLVNAADLWRNRAIVADPDAISVGVADAGTLRTHIFAADTAAIAQTLPDSGLYRNRAVIAETGAITLGAPNADLIVPHEPLAAEVSSIAVSAKDAALYRNRAVIAEPASVELNVRQTGADSTIMPGESAPFAFTANDATLTRTILFAAETAGVAESVADAGLVRALALSASAGDLAFGSQDAGFLRGLLLQTDGASYALGLSDATPSNNLAVIAEAAEHAATFPDAGLRKTLVMVADGVSFGQTASDAAFDKFRLMTAERAEVALNEHANSLLTARMMTADKVGFGLSVNGVVDPPILTMGFGVVNYALSIGDGAFLRALRLVIEPFAVALAEFGQDYTLIAEPAGYSVSAAGAGMHKVTSVFGMRFTTSLQVNTAELLLHKRLRADVSAIRLNAPPGTTFLTANTASYAANGQDARVFKFRALVAQAAVFAEQAKDANLARAIRMIADHAKVTLNAQPGGDTPIYSGVMFETDFGGVVDTMTADVVSEVMVMTT